MALNRRVLIQATAATLLPALAGAQPLRPGAHQVLLARFANGRTPQAGRLRIRVPEIADNGASVPLTLSVDGPDRITRVLLVNDGNPNPEVMAIEFGPLAARAEVSTRIRAAQSMNVIGYAETASGQLFMGRADVRVTIGGCGT